MRPAKHNCKSWLGECVHSHLSDDTTVAKMGHPFVCGWVGKNKQLQQQLQRLTLS